MASGGALSGLRVLCTGLQADTDRCVELVREMGGEFIPKFSLNKKPDVLVARDVTTEKYMAVVNACKVRVVLPSWLEACRAAGRQVFFSEHALGPFVGLRVCATGFLPPARDALQAAVEKGGGDFRANLTRDVTHLVCTSPADPRSKKLKVGKKWKLKIVTDKWVFDSCEAQGRRDELHYPVRLADGSAAAPTAALIGLPPLIVTNESASQSAVGTNSASHQPSGMQPDTTEPHRSSSCRAFAAGWEASDILTSQASGLRGESAISPAAAVVASPGHPLFLDGLRVALACCTPEEQAEQARLAREAGATRDPVLTARTTHVVVGSDRSEAGLKAVRGHMGRYSAHTQLVSVQWLRECATQRAAVVPDGPLEVPHSNLTAAAVGQRRALAAPAAAATPRSEHYHLAAGLPAGRGEASGSLPVATAACKPVEGLSFTLAAVAPFPEVAERAAVLIRSGGGYVIDGRGSVPKEVLEKSYAICPLGFPPRMRDQAMGSPLFREVDKQRWVTVHWLEFTQQLGEFFRPKSSLLFQPLVHALPLPWMAGIKVCVSGYDETKRSVVKTLTKQLGGKYTAAMGKSNTHLILPEATGQKYEGCETMGVIPVTCDWLLACAAKGVHISEAKYPPKPAPGDQQQQAATCRPFMPPGQAMPSQILTTQMPPADRQRGIGGREVHRQPGLLNLSQSNGGSSQQQPSFLDKLLQDHKVRPALLSAYAPCLLHVIRSYIALPIVLWITLCQCVHVGGREGGRERQQRRVSLVVLVSVWVHTSVRDCV